MVRRCGGGNSVCFLAIVPTVFLTFMVFSCGASYMAMEKHLEKQVVGGPCQYKSYPGRAAIISVKKAVDGCEIRFSFAPDEPIEEEWVQAEGNEHLLLLANSRFPGPRFLEKYGIEPGTCFECHMKIITKGTCTPVLFDFSTIDLTDYAE